MPLGSELNKNSIRCKQHWELNKVYEYDKKESGDETINKEEKDDDKTTTITKYDKSNLIYDSKHRFYKYIIKECDNILNHNIHF